MDHNSYNSNPALLHTELDETLPSCNPVLKRENGIYVASTSLTNLDMQQIAQGLKDVPPMLPPITENSRQSGCYKTEVSWRGTHPSVLNLPSLPCNGDDMTPYMQFLLDYARHLKSAEQALYDQEQQARYIVFPDNVKHLKERQMHILQEKRSYLLGILVDLQKFYNPIAMEHGGFPFMA